MNDKHVCKLSDWKNINDTYQTWRAKQIKRFFFKNPANSHLFKWLFGGNWVYEITLKFNQDCVN